MLDALVNIPVPLDVNILLRFQDEDHRGLMQAREVCLVCQHLHSNLLDSFLSPFLCVSSYVVSHCLSLDRSFLEQRSQYECLMGLFESSA